MRFAEIENLVGGLPDSARLHRTWWSNGSNIEAGGRPSSMPTPSTRPEGKRVRRAAE
jgi:hypothetical protein